MNTHVNFVPRAYCLESLGHLYLYFICLTKENRMENSHILRVSRALIMPALPITCAHQVRDSAFIHWLSALMARGEQRARRNGSEVAAVCDCVSPLHSVQLLSEQSSCCCGGRPALLSVPWSTRVPLHTVSRDPLGPSITTRATGAGLQTCNEQTSGHGLFKGPYQTLAGPETWAIWMILTSPRSSAKLWKNEDESKPL